MVRADRQGEAAHDHMWRAPHLVPRSEPPRLLKVLRPGLPENRLPKVKRDGEAETPRQRRSGPLSSCPQMTHA